MIVLVTGGARSGKSSFAEQYAAHLGSIGVYIATAQTLDDEMQTRALRHRDRREQANFVWNTVEEPLDICGELSKLDNSIILVDCLTLWLSNWLLHYEHEEDPESQVLLQIDRLVTMLSGASADIILVTNEVGDSVVPEYSLGRMFRDLAGTMNQLVANVSSQVFLVTAGIPIELKSKQYHFPLSGTKDGNSNGSHNRNYEGNS